MPEANAQIVTYIPARSSEGRDLFDDVRGAHHLIVYGWSRALISSSTSG